MSDRDADYAEAMQRYVHEDGDAENDHAAADRLLCELLNSLGYEQTVAAWSAVRKWYA